MKIIALPLVTHGDAFLNSETSVSFTVDEDFVGMAYVKYVVEDSLGTKKTGNISYCVVDPFDIGSHDTIRIATTNSNPATIMLPVGGFYVDPDNGPSLGDVSFIGTDVVEYTPNFLSDGDDTFILLKGGGSYSRTVIVSIILFQSQTI